MAETVREELIGLTQRLLDSIVEGDWETYRELCDPSLTAFEPEASSQLVEGMDFHQFYFDTGDFSGTRNTTICGPHVRVMGEVAVVSYVRLIRLLDRERKPVTAAFEETRVWERQEGRWQHVHFHRSANG